MELRRAAVWAGVLSGVGLTLEAAFFMASGWSAEAFATFEGAVGVLRDGGSALRLAVVFGVFNLAFLAIFFAGLARHLEQRSATLGAVVLYLGMIGIAIHAIVPIGLYQAVPAFQGMAAGPEAEASWRAFRMVLDVAQGAGGLFMGLAMVATGIAALAYRLLPARLRRRQRAQRRPARRGADGRRSPRCPPLPSRGP